MQLIHKSSDTYAHLHTTNSEEEEEEEEEEWRRMRVSKSDEKRHRVGKYKKKPQHNPNIERSLEID